MTSGMTVERIPTYVGDKVFTHIPEHVREDLDSLARECVVYANHWIEEIGDFRHVRIKFLPEEREEFIRRSWAYELFIRAGYPKWASETPGIDLQIASEADKYSPKLKDGTRILPPYHCFASFLGEHLELLLIRDSDRHTVIDLEGRELVLFEVKRTIRTLTPTIRSFNNREKGLDPWRITCEDDVRDLLYVMLRPRVLDLTKEEAIPSRAGSYKLVDLCSKAIPFMVELKWIGKKGDLEEKDRRNICGHSIIHSASSQFQSLLCDSRFHKGHTRPSPTGS